MSIDFDDENETIKIVTDQGNTLNIGTMGARFCDLTDINPDIRKCANCRALENHGCIKKLKKCGYCREVYYCDVECQKYDWNTTHKNKCSRKYKK